MKIPKNIKYQTSNIKLKRGVTLIELSIVIVIIALVVTGIVGGEQLMKNHQITTIIKNKNEVEGYFNSFQLQYKALPGDYDEAFNIWGAKCANSAANCNGNGDNIIRKDENVKAWRQIELAKIANLGLKAITTSPEKCATITRLPAFDIENSTAFFDYINSNNIATPSSTTLGFVNSSTTANYVPYQSFVFSYALPKATPTAIDNTTCGANGFLKVEQAYLVDKKADDGFAYSGRILGSSADSTCVSGTVKDWVVQGGDEVYCKLYVGKLKVY